MPYLLYKDFRLPNIKYAFFTKNIPNCSCKFLNFSYETLDTGSIEEIECNRKKAIEVFNEKSVELSLLKQVHSAEAVIIENPFQIGKEPSADGHVTKKKNIALGVLTADCVPILFFDQEKQIIGSAHAGWRGALKGIVRNTLAKMKKIGAEKITAIIGPCIQQSSYEVSKDFYNNFLEENLYNDNFFIPSLVENKFLFNLPEYVINQLNLANIHKVYNLNMNTFTAEDKFFSHRRSTLRNEERVGCNLSIITII